MKHVTIAELIAELQELEKELGSEAPVVLWVGRLPQPVGTTHKAALGKSDLRYFVSRGGVPCVVISDASRV